MNPSTSQINQMFEGLAATGMRTMLWDSEDNLLYADPGMAEIYQNDQHGLQGGEIRIGTRSASSHKCTKVYQAYDFGSKMRMGQAKANTSQHQPEPTSTSQNEP